MSRITDTFQRLRRDGKKGFIPFVTAGDPDLDTSLDIILKLAELGADVIELGVPFSDPMADGPTIQRSSDRALCRGTKFTDVLDLASRFRDRSDVDEARGVDGVLLTDVVEGEAQAISSKFAERDIDLISLVAPTTSDDRLPSICSAARGFIYAVSRAGVTGARADTSSQAETLVERVQRLTDLPIAVGFGISTAEQVRDVWRYADAAVVGSAIVSEIEKAEPSQAVQEVEAFVRSLVPDFVNAGA
jgi:tryptophan synthase alpha chain